MSAQNTLHVAISPEESLATQHSLIIIAPVGNRFWTAFEFYTICDSPCPPRVSTFVEAILRCPP